MKIRSEEKGSCLRALCAASVLVFVILSISHAFQASEKEKRAAYAKSVIKTFTSGEIIELEKIPDNIFFEKLIKDQAWHDGINEEEQRKKMIETGIMKYVIGLLRDGQISLTEYVNLRPDIHWVEALRMAYVGDGSARTLRKGAAMSRHARSKGGRFMSVGIVRLRKPKLF